MAISFISSAQANATSVTMPTHQAGDLIIAFAYRSSVAAAPGDPGGTWTTYSDFASASPSFNANGLRFGWKIAASSSETSGTWSNATSIMVAVYRGAEYRSHAKVTSGTDWPSLSGLATTDWGIRGGVKNTVPAPPSGWTPLYGQSRMRTAHTNGAIGATSIGTTSSGVGSGIVLFTVALKESAVAYTADASISVTANRTADVQHGKTAQATFPITSTLTAAVSRSAAAEATLSLLATLLAGTTTSSAVGSTLQITVDRAGETTMTTQSGTTIVSSASLQSSITITRYGDAARPITASTSGSISLDAAGEADRVINVSLEATAATGILAKQLDVSTILLAAAQVAGVTGGNMWTTTILESTAAVYSNIASLDFDVLADVLVQAVNVAPGSVDADATEASLTAAVTALRNVNAASPLVAALIAETVQLFGAVAQESVTAVLPASVQGALSLTGLRSALVGLNASAFTEFRPIAPGIRTVHIGRDDRVMRTPADDRTLKVRPDRPMRVHLG